MAWKQKRGTSPIVTGLAAGLLVSMVMTFAVAVVITFLIAGERLGEEVTNFGALVSLLLGAISGALTAAGIARERRMIVCLLSGAVYFASLLCCTALFFGGQYQGIGMTALVIFGGSTATGIVGLKGRRRTPSRLRKLRVH